MSIVIKHVATIKVYAIKDELGGGFRAVYRNHETEERVESDVFTTMAEGRFWAKTQAHNRHTSEGYKFGYGRPSKTLYRVNIWCNRNDGRVSPNEHA